jgi:hypothetical protein
MKGPPVRFSVKWRCILVALVFVGPGFLQGPTSPAVAQKNKPAAPAGPLIKRTTTRRESSRFGYGGTVTVIGAPQGSITVEGWPRSEVEVVADIELNAENEDDLNRLAAVNTFAFDDDTNHVRILTTGTHDKAFMRRATKNFPKTLLTLPWKIDYRIKVPIATDLEINGGRGSISLIGVEGAIRINAVESEASMVLTGGIVSATIATGNVLLKIPVRSWRGGGADVRVAAGTLTVELAPGFNGDINADVLRAGKIEDAFGAFALREKPGLTPTVVRARAGSGGAFFKFTVGDGTLLIKKGEVSDR